MLEKIRKYYDPTRLEFVDSDYLLFEEGSTSQEDLELIYKLLSSRTDPDNKLSNGHNSIMLYVTTLSDEFDFDKARSDTIDGSPPDCN